MDFQFTHYLGNVHAKCSMEHIALANWFNSEVGGPPRGGEGAPPAVSAMGSTPTSVGSIMMPGATSSA